MKTVRYISLGLVCCWIAAFIQVAAVTASGQDAAPAPTANSGAAADDPASPLFLVMCSDCHDSVRIVSQRRTKDDWQDVLNQMIEKGAQGNGKDFEAVFGYLLRHHGKVFINNAVADELTAVLELSKPDAEALIAYRSAHGAFADFDALMKVPAIDTKRIEAHKDAITF